MVSPVQFSNNSQVYFRANDDLISSPGSYQQQAVPETPADEVVLSTQEESPKKKGGIGKTIAYSVGGLAVTAGALFGLFKWKGDKWLNPAAEGIMGKLKNYLVKPGEWLDKQGKALLAKCGIGKAAEKTAAESGADVAAGAEKAAGEAAADAAAGAEKTAGEVVADAAAGAEKTAGEVVADAAAGAEKAVGEAVKA